MAKISNSKQNRKPARTPRKPANAETQPERIATGDACRRPPDSKMMVRTIARSPNEEQQEPLDEPDDGITMFSSPVYLRGSVPPRWLVQDLLMPHQLSAIAGPPDARVTDIALDLAISLGSGAAFLDSFPVPKVTRVGVFNWEVDSPAMRQTAMGFARLKEINWDKLDVWWTNEVPDLATEAGLSQLALAVRQHALEVVMINAFQAGLTTRRKMSSISRIRERLDEVMQDCLKDCGTLILTPFDSPFDDQDQQQIEADRAVQQHLHVSRQAPTAKSRGRHGLLLRVVSATQTIKWSLELEESR